LTALGERAWQYCWVKLSVGWGGRRLAAPRRWSDEAWRVVFLAGLLLAVVYAAVPSALIALVAFTVLSFVYFGALNGTYLTLTALAWTRMTGDSRRRRYLGLDDIMRSPLTPGITVLVPALQ
jgi:hypothetical protein